MLTVPLAVGCSFWQKRTAAKIHQGTSTRGMGLPVNLAVANSGAGARNMEKSVSVMILISFPM